MASWRASYYLDREPAVNLKRYRDFVIGLAEDHGFLGKLAIRTRWHCSEDGEIGLGFKMN